MPRRKPADDRPGVKRLNLRLSPKEHLWLKRQALDRGLSLQGFALDLLRAQVARVKKSGRAAEAVA